MTSHAVRRIVLSTAIVATLTCQSSAQTLLAVALSDLSRYFDAAARFVANAVSGLDKVGAAGLSSDERTNAIEELRKVSGSIASLRAEQRILIGDFTDYADAVRERGFASVRDVQRWSSILSSIQSVSAIVGDALELVDGSTWLTVALSAEDRLALREVLGARVSLLSRLRDLPAPGAPDEIDQLERMNARYLELHKSLGALNVALTRAADKLAGR